MTQTTDGDSEAGELENAGAGENLKCNEESQSDSDIEEISWDGLLIEDEDDDDAMYVDLEY